MGRVAGAGVGRRYGWRRGARTGATWGRATRGGAWRLHDPTSYSAAMATETGRSGARVAPSVAPGLAR
jgi:hypothetical protein